MFGSGGSSPKPPAYTPPPPYQNAPTYTQAPAFNSLGDFNDQVPAAMTPLQVVQSGLQGENALTGPGGYAPWLSLQNAPTDQANMQAAESEYLQNQGLPQMAANASALNANGQGGSSYAGAFLGQEAAMNNLNAFNAGLNQQETDFGNVLNARNALYGQPVQLASSQNALDIQRGLGVGQLNNEQNMALNAYNLANNQGFNAYNLSNNQGFNSYNLGANENQNQFNSNIFGTEGSIANANTAAGANEFGSIVGGIATLGSGYLQSLRSI